MRDEDPATVERRGAATIFPPAAISSAAPSVSNVGEREQASSRGEKERSTHALGLPELEAADVTSLLPTSDNADASSTEASIPEALLDGYRVMMRRWCRNSLKGPLAARADTSDVVQESLVQVWKDWNRLRGRSAAEIHSWMYRVAQGHLAKVRRHHRAAKRNVTRQVEPDEQGIGDFASPEESLRTAERRLKLTIALEALPRELNEVVRMRLFAMLSFRQIGDELGIDREEARARFLRAVRRLRSDLSASEVLA